jgi:hypothetical protein
MFHKMKKAFLARIKEWLDRITKIAVHIWTCLMLYRMGYFLSSNTGKGRDKAADSAGFYRLNYEKNGVKEYCILDVDFMRSRTRNYSHIHGGPRNATIFRFDDWKITRSSR